MNKQHNLVPIFIGFFVSILIVFAIQFSSNQVYNKEVKRNNDVLFLLEKISITHNQLYFWADKILFSPNAVSNRITENSFLITKYMRILSTGGKINDAFDNVEQFQLSKDEVALVDTLNLSLKRLNNHAKLLQQLKDEITTTTSFASSSTKAEFPTEFTIALANLSDAHQKVTNTVNAFRSNIENQNQIVFRLINIVNFVAVGIMLLISLSIFYFIYTRIFIPLEFIKKVTEEALIDKFRENISIKSYTLPERIIQNLKILFLKFQNTNEVIRLISEGHETEVKDELLDKSLLKKSFSLLINNLIQIKQTEERRRKDEEIQNWINKGVVEISEVFKLNNDNIILLSEQIISKIVNYVDAAQGGIFIYDSDTDKEHLNLVASYAYGRKRFVERKVKLGQTLVGACAMEKHRILLTKVPEEYYQIDSGLGNATPKNLLLHPLIMENTILGVIELASFNDFTQKEIDLIERVGANIAISLSNAQNNLKTIRLLEQSQLQNEKIQTREEKLKIIITEREKFHKEFVKQEKKYLEFVNAMNSAISTIKINLNGEILEMNKNAMLLFSIPAKGLEALKYLVNLKSKKSDAELMNIKETIETVKNGNQIKGENVYSSLQGEDIYVYEYWNALKNDEDKTEELLIIMFDITQTKKQEVMLREKTLEMQEQENMMTQNIEEMMNLQIQWNEKEKTSAHQLEKALSKIKELEDIMNKKKNE